MCLGWFFFTHSPTACVQAKLLQSCLALCDPMGGPLSKGFFRQEHWSGLSGPPPGDLPDPGIEPESLLSKLHWQACSSPPVPPGKPLRPLLPVK